MTTKRIVRAAIVAALYATLTISLGPISFGPLQFRAANLLMALMLFDLDFCFGLAFGCAIGNLTSPFGLLDWVVMPVVTFFGAVSAFGLRHWWVVAIVAWALITSIGVSVFPLGLGASIPFLITFPFVLAAQTLSGFGGYVIWKPFEKFLAGNHRSPPASRVRRRR